MKLAYGGSVACHRESSAMSCTVPHQLSAWHAVSPSQISRFSVGIVFGSCNYKMMLASSVKLKACCVLYFPYQRTFLGDLAVWWCSWNLINILLQNISDGAICVAVGWSLLSEASIMWMQRATFWGGLNGIISQVTNKHFNWCLQGNTALYVQLVSTWLLIKGAALGLCGISVEQWLLNTGHRPITARLLRVVSKITGPRVLLQFCSDSVGLG